MDLLIDTTERDRMILGLLEQGRVVAKLDRVVAGLSENLLPELQKFLKKHKVKLNRLTRIYVNPGPGAFSSTRTGVATANALAFALGVPVAEWPSGRIKKFILPRYDKEPNITKPSRLSYRT